MSEKQTFDLKEAQTVIVGTVKAVVEKAYGSAGKTMQSIFVEREGYEGRIIPYEVKSFKVKFDGREGDRVELMCYVNGSYGKTPALQGRVFTDLTLADFSIITPSGDTDSGTVETAADAATEKDEGLPF